MRNARLFLAALMSLATSSAAAGQTARGYFNELRDANAFEHYGDEYVCFPDEDKGGFAIVAKTKDIEKMVAANSKAGAKPKPLGEEGLVAQTYFQRGCFASADIRQSGQRFRRKMEPGVQISTAWQNGLSN